MKFTKWVATFRYLAGRSRAYRDKFPDPTHDVVLMDLARFCHAAKSTFSKDPYEAARLQGRHEVWLRICEQRYLSPEQQFVLYNHPSVVADYSQSMEEPNG